MTIHLTPREKEVLNILTTRGASNKVIARMLDLSENTVKMYIGQIMKKYGAQTRSQLMAFIYASHTKVEAV